MKNMSKRDATLIKNMIFLVVTLVLLIIVVLSSIIPNLEAYRTKSVLSRQNMTKLNFAKEEYDKTLKDFTELQIKTKSILQNFQNRFSISKFLKDTRKFFQNTSMVEVSQNESEKYFKMYEFEATSDIKTPVTFYEFLEYLSIYDNIIEVDFPIIFNSKGNLISAKFRLKVHNLKK